jgi:MFS family permease
MNGVWLSLAVTMAIQALVSLVVFAPPVLAPVAVTEIGVPASAIGILTALIYSSAAFAALRSGGTIGRYGPMRASQMSLLLCAVGIALFASGNVVLVGLGALVIGLGYGAVTPSSSAILAERVPPTLRAFIFSLKQTGVPIGGTLAGALVPALMLAFGWKAAAMATGGLCLGLMVAVQPWRRAVDSGSRMPDAEPLGLIEPLRLVLADRRLREMAWAAFAYSGMQMCLGSFLVVFLHEHAGASVAAAGVALSVAMAAGVCGRILWGVAADNWVKPRLLLGGLGVAMALAAFATAAVSASWPLLPVLAVSMAYGATAVGWNGVYLSEVARTAPAGQAAAATGASLALTYCGVVTLPLLFWAMVATTGSYTAAFGVVGLLTLWRGAVLLRR